MVSFSVPSFRSTPTSSPLRPNDSSTNSNTNNASSAMISERALRNNPFGITSRTRTSAALKPAAEDWRREQEELNQALQSLARIFPDIRVEVFRELLVRFDGTSRLHVCVEQLLRHKEEWVAGRWNVPGGTTGSTADGGAAAAVDTASTATATASGGDPLVIPPHELFRSPRYKAAVKAALAKEFSALSKSTVEAVLAEVNFCYLRARPTLQDLSRKTWRATLNSFLPLFKRSREKNEHPLVVWQRPAAADGEAVPRLKETGCEELDRELHEALLAPLLRTRREEQERKDLALAETLNEDEAKAAEALYECECCFADVTFEQIATCSDSMHVICYGCIRRTIHEALFGQGWNKSVDVGRVTLKCIAPFGGGGGGRQDQDGCCQGSLSAAVVKRAIQLDRSGAETYAKFEARVASDALRKSQLKLIHCPSCAYAEVDPIHHPSSALVWRFRGEGLISSFIIAVFILDLIPLLLIPVTVMYLLNPAAIRATFRTALLNTTLRTRPKRFTCANPACQRVSCIACQKPWRDPHVCHEPLLLDLRATVEAARTAAVKRTCPRCGLSFVKSTGCNKLTCVCGYSMCYLCRKALTSTWTGGLGGGRERNRRRAPAARRRHNAENIPLHQRNFPAQPHNPDPDSEAEDEVVVDDDEEEEEELEGYKHFCQHFRINPGARCTECTKCELYQDEDEEAVARRAGEKAEREWHARHRGTATAAAAGALHVNRDFSVRSSKEGLGRGPKWSWTYLVEEVWSEGRWKVEAQAFVDWVVDCVVVVEEG
ncbi:hypothetical protein ASPACDRAFT_126182 [Aspergillus aculeatus ATCC 16872]|uniref:RING-type domain-containing protein n=1 Tax=Aspergillus aculeatus (strain ATCC 16872 / CBS 172.66 / WB 5094) TaxID=690307 RepID=A0A1L9WIH5_ASPA1|nr:uncharacterized protein ASPACDRAFT_126182 [Aspergillus aculeatus ATCC 16872]OJJ95905.1 hypothetical protein ASPACDRAFT_126182 [Aspergillus aculeatus ATCC 16872]